MGSAWDLESGVNTQIITRLPSHGLHIRLLVHHRRHDLELQQFIKPDILLLQSTHRRRIRWLGNSIVQLGPFELLLC